LSYQATTIDQTEIRRKKPRCRGSGEESAAVHHCGFSPGGTFRTFALPPSAHHCIQVSIVRVFEIAGRVD